MTNLQYLDVSFNNLTGLAPAGWSPISSLVEVHLQGNSLQGDLFTTGE